MNKAYLLTGGNEGDRYLNMQQARTNIEHICGRILQVSSLYETAPWGNTRPGGFSQPGIAGGNKYEPAIITGSHFIN